jgi:hypothetical protein
LADAPKELQGAAKLFGPALAQGLKGLGALSEWIPEDRTPEQYDESVALHLDSLRNNMQLLARGRAVDAGIGVVELAITNHTEHNHSAVVVDLYVPGDVCAYLDVEQARDAAEDADIVGPPRPWGPRRKSIPGLSKDMLNPALTFGRPNLRPRPKIDNSGSARIRFPAVDLRPEHTVALDEVHLVVLASDATAIVAEWSATSTSMSGVARGTISIPLSDAIPISTLFSLPARESAD